MSYTTRFDDTYDPGDFSGVIQQDTFQVEAPAGGDYYWKKPSYTGDTNIYHLVMIVGLPKPVIMAKGSIIYSDALATTPVAAGLIYASHFGG